MRNLPIVDFDALAMLLRSYSMDAIESNPRPYQLMMLGDAPLDVELGIYYDAGDFATYEGACLEAELAERPAKVYRVMYRVKPGVPPRSALVASSQTLDDIADMQRALGARRAKA